MAKNMLDGGQVIVDYLVREKVPYVFGLCGHGNIGFIDALYERSDEIKTISVHHESVAGFMADVYYRVAGQPTATFTSCGPGSANLPIALANSYLDSVPFLAVTGNVPTSQFNRGAFQELYRHYQADFPSTVRACCKRVFQPTRGDMVPLAIRQAWKTMVTGPPGPVVLDVPFDIFKEAAAEETPKPQDWNAGISCRCGADPARRRAGPRHAACSRASRHPGGPGRQIWRCGGRPACALRSGCAFRWPGPRAAPAPSIPTIPWRSDSSHATAPTRPIMPRAPPMCCSRSACASTTARRARGSRATRSPFRRPSSFMWTSIPTRSRAIIRSRSA